MGANKVKPTLTKGVAKVPVVMQLEALECGAAALCMVMAYYGKWVPLEQARIDDIIYEDRMPPVRVTANAEELLTRALEQNFVPVVDDRDIFVGIITRRAILSYCIEQGVIADEEARDVISIKKEA